jgi:hypothetical protein
MRPQITLCRRRGTVHTYTKESCAFGAGQLHVPLLRWIWLACLVCSQTREISHSKHRGCARSRRDDGQRYSTTTARKPVGFWWHVLLELAIVRDFSPRPGLSIGRRSIDDRGMWGRVSRRATQRVIDRLRMVDFKTALYTAL